MRSIYFLVACLIAGIALPCWVYRVANVAPRQKPIPSPDLQAIQKFLPPKFEVPKAITVDLLKDTEDTPFLLWEYVLSLFDKRPELYRDQTAHDSFIESLPRGLQIVHDYTSMDGDILNGGIRQFFHNHTPWEVQRTIDALEEFNATETASLIQKAIPVYEQHTDWKRGSRERFKGPSWQDPDYGAESTLNAIDDARCNDNASKRDYQLLKAYLRQHPERCVHPGPN